MGNFWRNYKFEIIIIVYILVIALSIRFVVFPWVGEIKNKANSIQEKIVDNQINRMRMGEIPKMEETYNDYQEKKNTMEVIINPDDEVGFIKKVEALAEDSGNGITLKIAEGDNKAAPKSPAKKGQEKGIKESLSYDSYISMEIELKGGYTNLVSFMRKLENMYNYVNIISVQSRKTTETLEQSSTSNRSSEIGVFIPVEQAQARPVQEVKKEEEIIVSVINVIVYTKK